MVKIGLISDTHIPSRFSRIPDKVWEKWGTIDMVIHSGDWDDEEAYLQLLQSLEDKIPLFTVSGNCDHFYDEQNFPSQRIVECQGFRIGVTHGWGSKSGIVQRAFTRFAGEPLDVLVYGHTHEAEISDSNGVLVVNPGSPTDDLLAGRCTIGLLTITNKVEPEILQI